MQARDRAFSIELELEPVRLFPSLSNTAASDPLATVSKLWLVVLHNSNHHGDCTGVAWIHHNSEHEQYIRYYKVTMNEGTT